MNPTNKEVHAAACVALREILAAGPLPWITLNHAMHIRVPGADGRTLDAAAAAIGVETRWPTDAELRAGVRSRDRVYALPGMGTRTARSVAQDGPSTEATGVIDSRAIYERREAVRTAAVASGAGSARISTADDIYRRRAAAAGHDYDQ